MSANSNGADAVPSHNAATERGKMVARQARAEGDSPWVAKSKGKDAEAAVRTEAVTAMTKNNVKAMEDDAAANNEAKKAQAPRHGQGSNGDDTAKKSASFSAEQRATGEAQQDKGARQQEAGDARGKEATNRAPRNLEETQGTAKGVLQSAGDYLAGAANKAAGATRQAAASAADYFAGDKTSSSGSGQAEEQRRREAGAA